MSNKRSGGDMEKARAGKRSAVETDERDGLTPKQRAFVREYLVDRNGTAAAVRAGYSPHTANEQSSELLAKPNIKELVAEREQRLAEAAEVDATLVISELYKLAVADPRDLMRVETDSCRHCYGLNHGYMWTPAEYQGALRKALSAGEAAPDVAGGLGYDPRKPPVEGCPECFGRGIERVVVTPTQKLSRGAARLIASVKQTKDGIEIKTLDQQAALLALGRIVGIDKQRSELTGPNGAPIQLQPVPRPEPRTLSNEELEAALKSAGYPLIEGSITS
jgi:phage terminase small subunit